MKRRRFVQTSVAAGLAASPLGRVLGEEELLPRTPSDFEGPYYPVGPRNRSNDLVLAEPREKVLHLRGRVVDVRGNPLHAALVDIWHTDPLGRYRHPRDRSAGERWDDFLYWGEATTDADGRFSFRTYVPGAYEPRPAHIHYKVWEDRTELLTSQIYFAELGGTRGKSRLPERSSLQTVRLEPLGDASLQAVLQIVI
jgi:protocatechuate 3,4-dioxygenase beta subunit